MFFLVFISFFFSSRTEYVHAEVYSTDKIELGADTGQSTGKREDRQKDSVSERGGSKTTKKEKQNHRPKQPALVLENRYPSMPCESERNKTNTSGSVCFPSDIPVTDYIA
jgi:hypothetical protein